MARILFHIGLPKTATTTLQQNVFYDLHKKNKINFLGRYLDSNHSDFYYPINEIILKIGYENNKDFENNLAKYRNIVNNFLRNDILNVISEEMFTISYDFESLNIRKNLERFRMVFINHEIETLISIRKQKDIIYSFFVEAYSLYMYKDKNNDTLEKYVKNGLSTTNNNDFLMYDYNAIINIIEEILGPNIYILVFEDLKYKIDRYMSTLSLLLNIDKNILLKKFSKSTENEKLKTEKGYKIQPIRLDKYVYHLCNKSLPQFLVQNYLFNRMYKTLLKILKIFIFKKEILYLNTDLTEQVQVRFNESNEVLDKNFSLNLYEYGYYKKSETKNGEL